LSYGARALRKTLSARKRPQYGIEESFNLKRKKLLSILAVISAALMPLAASSQIAPEKPASQTTEPAYKWELFAGWGYTSLNQVTNSNSGLQGVSLSGTRDFGKYFGLTVEGGHYAWTLTRSNTYPTTVNHFLAGPVFHAPLYEKVGIFVHGLIGAVNTEMGDGVEIRPAYSFGGGIGIGLDYKLDQHWGVRAYGDYIGSSFTEVPFQPGFSPHRRFNAHAAAGVTYKF
jgi:opacity protein-like surface antigen